MVNQSDIYICVMCGYEQVKSWLWQLEDRCSCDNSSMPLCNGDISPPIPPYNNGYVSSGLGVMTGGNSSQTSAAAPAATTSLPPPPLPHMPPMLFPGGQSLYSVPPPPPAPFVSAPPFGRSLSCDDYDSRSSSSGSSNGSGNGINRATTKYPSMLHPPLKVSISAQQQQQQTSDTGYPLRGSVSSYTTQPPVVPAVHPTAGLTLQTCHSPGQCSSIDLPNIQMSISGVYHEFYTRYLQYIVFYVAFHFHLAD